MIHIPNLMPDEDVRTYWGRVLRLNAVRALQVPEARFIQDVCDRISASNGKKPELVAVVSSVTDISLATIISGHTLVPFSGAVLPVVNGDWCDQSYASRELRRVATHGSALALSLCTQCISEDLDFWGFSYWRRSQQLPGIVSCFKHGTALFRVRELSTCQTMPHEALAQACPESSGVAAQASDHPVLRRYAEACAEFLDRPRPLSTLQVLSALTRRATKIRLIANAAEPGQSLSNFATSSLSDNWQRIFRKGSRDASADIYCHALDATLSRIPGVCEPQAYALALALLYDSIDEAFNDVSRPLPSLPTFLPTIELEAEKRAPNELPRSLQTNLARKESLRQAIQMVLAGGTLYEAARAHNWSPAKLERILRTCLTTAAVDSLAEEAS